MPASSFVATSKDHRLARSEKPVSLSRLSALRRLLQKLTFLFRGGHFSSRVEHWTTRSGKAVISARSNDPSTLATPFGCIVPGGRAALRKKALFVRAIHRIIHSGPLHCSILPEPVSPLRVASLPNRTYWTLVNSKATMVDNLSLRRSRSRVPVVVPNEESRQETFATSGQGRPSCLSVAKATTLCRSSLPFGSLTCHTEMSQPFPAMCHRCHVVDVYNPLALEGKIRDSISDNDSGIFPGSSASSAESDRSWHPDESLSVWRQRTGSQPLYSGSEQFRPRLYSKGSNASIFVPRRQTKLQRTHSNLVTQRRARKNLQSANNEPPPYDVALARISELRGESAFGGVYSLSRSFTLRCPKGQSEWHPQIGQRSQSMNCIYDLSDHHRHEWQQEQQKSCFTDKAEFGYCEDNVHGKIIGIASDGSRLVDLRRPNRSVPYGFVVSLATRSGKKGLYVENVFEKSLADVLKRGDQILEIDSVPVRVKHISEVYNVLRTSCRMRLKVLPLVG
uniref:PDZ domain-containing protein n=1 Tax=Trichuris muris TaxID=70415 RepID=A0A5S6QXZ6_TRIMR